MLSNNNYRKYDIKIVEIDGGVKKRIIEINIDKINQNIIKKSINNNLNN